MSHTALEKEIRALPESYISEISQFIVYLKLKERFSAFENSNSYENALALWRNDSAPLFSNSEDAAFMQNAFVPPHTLPDTKTLEEFLLKETGQLMDKKR